MPAEDPIPSQAGPVSYVTTLCRSGECLPGPLSYVWTEGSGFIYGTVTDVRSGQPLEGVEMWTESSETETYAETTSNIWGRYRLGPLDSGMGYRLAATGMPCHSYQFLEDIEVFAEGLQKNISMGRTGCVSGIVYGPFGGTVSDATVYFQEQDEPAWGEDSVTTDQNGRFAVCALDVAASDSAGSTYSISIGHPDYSGVEDMIFVPPHYSAQDEVRVEYSLSNPEPTILPPNPGSVSGTVTDLANQPVSGARVELLTFDTASPVAESVVTQANGAYEITGAPPSDDYLLSAMMPTAQVYLRFPLATAVSVATDQTTIKDLQGDTISPIGQITNPTSGGTVSGMVIVTVEASDNQAVDSVDLLVDGEEIDSILVSDAGNTSSWLQQEVVSFNWDTTSASNGSHTLTINVDDLAGNRWSADIIISVEN